MSFLQSTSVSAALIIGAMAWSSSSLAAPTDTLTIDPPAAFTANGQSYSFGLRAVQEDTSGIGDIWMGLKAGPWTDPNTNISVCTIHGEKAIPDAANPPNESGPHPDFECGRAYGMAVKITGCKLSAEYHGYTHIDAPYTAYLGFTTVDVDFEKKSGSDSELHVTIWTAAGKVKLDGKATGNFVMPSCH